MKRGNCIKSSLFLFAILFSFSVSAYNSLNSLSSGHLASLKKVNVDQPAGRFASNDILFEELENENDTEDFSSEGFLVLPFFFHSLAPASAGSNTCFVNSVPATTEPLFISLRVLRI